MNNINKIKTFAIHTLGCKVNIYDSNIIRNELLSYGLIELEFNTKADLYIINTCSVTNAADAKSRLYISKAKKNNPNAIVLVCGCYSQVNKEIDGVDIILGNKYKNNIIGILNEYLKTNNNLVKVDNLLLEDKFEQSTILNFENNTRAFIKIQEGCNYMCSYCIIPFTRGKQRSKPANNIIQEIKQLVLNNYKEIVLTGVNTAGYLDNNIDFEKLLIMINEIPGQFRVRISSVEPFQINQNIINLISNNPRFCQHWHICLQSGSDNVLKAMNRKYTTNDFLTLINYIYKLNPLAAITTDYICGFPTETDIDHQLSYEFVKKIGFYKMHIFPYSKRKYTMAATLKQVSDNVKKTRVNEFLALSSKLSTIYMNKFINHIVEVLFEQQIDENTYIGKSSEYLDVVVNSNENLINKICTVKINKVVINKLYGHILKKGISN